jgi:serine/threonine protein kinase
MDRPGTRPDADLDAGSGTARAWREAHGDSLNRFLERKTEARAVTCVGDGALRAYVDEELDASEWARVERHLAGCLDCLVRLDRLSESVIWRTPAAARERGSRQPIVLEPTVVKPGQRLGRYTIGERIGVGGTSVVYSAVDTWLCRRVALKLPRRDGFKSGSGREIRAGLLREAQALARVSHPHVVKLYQYERIADTPIIVMELLEGTTLLRWLQSHERSMPSTLDLVLRAGDGLLAAHRAGLVHRDFKPTNVMVTSDGRACLIDFGFAVPVAEDSRAASGKSCCARLVGTPAFMAPEQMVGRDADEKSDVFSYCQTLFYALHGERPFAGKTVRELHANIVARKLRHAAAERSVPGWVRDVVVSGLASRPEDRPALATIQERLRSGLANSGWPS